MNYKIMFKNSVIRDLKKIDADHRDKILKKIEYALPSREKTFQSLAGRFSGMRKFRIGNYRVVYTIIGDAVLVLRIRHRREVYR